jgi:S-phase kinase-associated protein 1
MEKEKGVGAAEVAAEKGKAAAAPAAESEAAEGEIVPLKSSDGLIFEVPAEVAKQFKAIADKACAADDDGTIPLPNVDGRTLCRVIEYGLEHHRMNDHPDDDIRSSLDWDDEFVSTLDVVGLEAVMAAAQHLGYERLLRRCRKAVRDMMVGKTGEEILATFGLENEFTPEEAEIAAKYAANVEDD